MATYKSIPCTIFGYHALGLVTIKAGGKVQIVEQKDITIEMVEGAL